MNTLFKHPVPTPLGLLTLFATDTGLTRILLPGDPATVPEARQGAKHPILEQAGRELTAWFAGTRREFDLPVDVVGSSWQRSVWNAVSTLVVNQVLSCVPVSASV